MQDTFHGKYETRLPPIAVDRHLKASLSEQVAEGLRHAIRTGFYRPGDILPPLGALCSRLDISLRVARDAIQRLTDDSLVLARPRVGCQVLQPNAKCHHGRVLAVASVENMTRGALAAFAHLGIKIPGDVGFVGTANDGTAPALSCTLACFRNNPFKNAGVVASALLRHLSGKEVPHDILYSPEFAFGDTFPRPDSMT